MAQADKCNDLLRGPRFRSLYARYRRIAQRNSFLQPRRASDRLGRNPREPVLRRTKLGAYPTPLTSAGQSPPVGTMYSWLIGALGQARTHELISRDSGRASGHKCNPGAHNEIDIVLARLIHWPVFNSSMSSIPIMIRNFIFLCA
jgi:hypothetical protein